MSYFGLFETGLLAATETISDVKSVQAGIPAWQWWTSLAVGLVGVASLLAFSYSTRSGIIARATTKEAVRQPVFVLMLLLALIVLVVNTFLPFFSLGHDIKMLKDCGLVTLLFSGLALAVWTASISVAEEIEGKTAMTLLSKPINRRQFVVGKYIGIVQAVLLLLIPLVIVFFLLLYYKVGYDARESSKEIPEWGFQQMQFNPLRLEAVTQVIPAIVLIVFEIAVLAAVSVAISIRLSMVVNVVTCLTIFVIGHLTPVLVKVEAQGLEPVKFVAQLIATILPSLEIFNMEAAVATGTMVPPVYLMYSMFYCVAYCTAAILLAFILFEDRDLA